MGSISITIDEIHVPETLDGPDAELFKEYVAVRNAVEALLREHRGHRLGTLVKVAAAELLGEHAPQVESVVTYNAEENRPMLDVNEAMGFRAIGYEGAWQKRI